MRGKLSSALFVLPLLMHGIGYSMDDAFVHLDTVAARLTPGKPDPSVVGIVADAVFSVPHFGLLQQVPQEVTAIVKRRFAVAEIAYWNGQHDGVGENDIASALNKIVAQLSLPDYAKTTQSQIRFLRIRTLQKNPRFLGLRFAKATRVGEPIAVSERMSPLQAYHLIMTLVDQKFVSAFYQVTPEEWERRSTKSQGGLGISRPKSRPHIVTNWDNPRIFEMQQRVASGLSSVSDAQGVAMLLETLSTMGIR